MTRKEKLLKIINYLSFFGILISIYLTYSHYSNSPDPFCNFGNFLSCDKVNKSIYSEIFGIPIAILGVLGYSAICVITILQFRKFDFTFFSKILIPNFINKIIFVLALLAFAFSLVLTYIELFVLYSLCTFCVVQQVVIFIILILSVLLVKKVELKDI